MANQPTKPGTHGADPSSFIVIAMTNSSRAAAFRSAALELTNDVVLANDGAIAKETIGRRGAPRLLITDLSLPTIDGFALVRHLRQVAPRTRSAVIVLSAHEALRTAARDLSESLGIAKVLRLDIDRPALRGAMAAAWGEVAPERPAPAPQRREEPMKKAVETGEDFEELLLEAALTATRRFHVAGAGVYVKIDADAKFVTYASAGNPVNLVTTASPWSTLQQVAASAEPLIVPDAHGHPVFGDTGVADPAVRGFASVPIMSPQGTSWGAICVIDVEPLTVDAAALEALIKQAEDLGRAINERVARQQATTFQALEQLAATDSLTGLANRRGGEKSIASEVSRAKREQKPLSCILIDIDRFKQVNDTFGHPAGDHVLRELSAILRRSVRAYDVVIRWGGEEFLVVLPGADLVAARALAERIRLAAEALEVQGIGAVTISAGIASFDEDYDFDATFRVADRRLYQAKAAGRNCVI